MAYNCGLTHEAPATAPALPPSGTAIPTTAPAVSPVGMPVAGKSSITSLHRLRGAALALAPFNIEAQNVLGDIGLFENVHDW